MIYNDICYFIYQLEGLPNSPLFMLGGQAAFHASILSYEPNHAGLPRQW